MSEEVSGSPPPSAPGLDGLADPVLVSLAAISSRTELSLVTCLMTA